MKNIPTTWYCQPRIWFFVVVFGVGYIFCVVLGLFVYILLMNRKREILFCRPRNPSVKSQNSFSAGSSRNGGSLKLKKDGSIRGPPSRTSSLRSQRNRPLSANGSLVRKKQDTSLPSVIPHIYRDTTDDDDQSAVDQESPRQSLLHRAPSLENLSIASYDTTMSLPVTFSTFKNRLFDAETASCHSFNVDSSLRRHRNRHHPRFHQELKRDRDIISARVRARFEAQEQQEHQQRVSSHQSDSQLYQDSSSATLPSRVSPGRRARRDFYRDLELARQHERERRRHRSDTQLNYDQETMTLPREGRAKRDFYRDLDLARMQERSQHHQSDSALGRDQESMVPSREGGAKRDQVPPREGRAKRDFYRDLNFQGKQEREPLLSNDNEPHDNIDLKYLTLPRPSSERPKRDFYRDLELASKRDVNHNKVTPTKDKSSHGPDSECEKDFERVLERLDLYRPKYRKLEAGPDRDDSDNCSIGDVLDRIADEDKPKRAATLPRSHKTFSNGYPPHMIRAKPIEDIHEDHLVVIAQEVPDGEAKKEKKNKKNKTSNKKDVKLRSHSSRRKDNNWKPRLSIVSEV